MENISCNIRVWGEGMGVEKFIPGYYAYIIISNVCVSKVLLINKNNGMYTIRLDSGGAIRVSESRLFQTYEAAMEAMKARSFRRSIRNW